MDRMVSSQPQRLTFSSGEADWSSGLCSCFLDVKQCCCEAWCGPCLACKTAKDLGECLCLPLLDVFCWVHPVAIAMRVSVRQRYGIRGSIARDCVCATCCRPCVWSQITTEMRKRRTNPVMLSDIIQQ